MLRWLSIVIMVAACTPEGAPVSTSPPPPSTTSTSAAVSPTTTAPDLSQGPCAAEGSPFQQDGNVGAVFADSSDASHLSRVGWESLPACERLVLEFTTAEGAPAVDPPTVSAFFIRTSGVLRLALGDSVTSTSIAEHLIDTGLVDRLFVVRSLDGSLFVDLHLADPAFARMSVASSPARAILDLQPGGPDYPGTPQRSGEVIVVEPLGSPVSYPFSVTGYVRSGESEISGVLTGLGEGESVQVTGSAGAQRDAWGGFVLLFPSGPDGRVTISVGGAISFETTVG